MHANAVHVVVDAVASVDAAASLSAWRLVPSVWELQTAAGPAACIAAVSNSPRPDAQTNESSTSPAPSRCALWRPCAAV